MNHQKDNQEKRSNSIYRTIGIVTISAAGILALISFIEFIDIYILGNTESIPVEIKSESPSSDAIAFSAINLTYGILFLSLLVVCIWSMLKAKIKTLLACFILMVIIGLSIFLIR